MKKKTVKEVKMHYFLVCACKSQDFAQSKIICARSHDRETVTFKNSVCAGFNISLTVSVQRYLGRISLHSSQLKGYSCL